MQAGRERDNHKRFSFLVVVLCCLLFYILSQIYFFWSDIFLQLTFHLKILQPRPAPPGRGGRVLLSMFIEAAVSGVTPRCVPCIRAGLRCCAGPCVMRPVLLLHTILAVDTTAGNEGPRSFHNHGEGPYYLA